VALEGGGGEIARAEELVEGREVCTEGGELEPLPPVLVGLGAVAWLAQNFFGALKYSSVPTRSIRTRLPDWTDTPPPSPSPFTSKSSRITFLPCAILPSMRTR
jgi:hypothetical protein